MQNWVKTKCLSVTQARAFCCSGLSCLIQKHIIAFGSSPLSNSFYPFVDDSSKITTVIPKQEGEIIENYGFPTLKNLMVNLLPIKVGGRHTFKLPKELIQNIKNQRKVRPYVT